MPAMRGVALLIVLCCLATVATALCPAGQYNDGGVCTACEPGAYCPGDDSLYPCSAGTYAPANAGLTSDACPPCPADGWCPGDGNYARCGSFKGTGGLVGQIDASACQCKPGYFGTVGVAYGCKACGSGTYSNVGSTAVSQCTAALCGVNNYCSNGVRYSCPYGSVAAVGSSVVTSCSCGAGYYGPGGASNCTDCPINNYCVGGAGYVACGAMSGRPQGMVTNGKNAKAYTDCKCAPGYYGTRDLGCTYCEAGYSCPGEGERIICADGLMSTAGSLSCTSCLPGYYCSNGLTRACGINSTQTTSLTSCACNPGFYGSAVDGQDCKRCPLGSYCAGGTPSSPISCGEGTTTVRTGAITVSECRCQGGYRGTGTVCTVCPARTYSAMGSSACSTCAPGSYAQAAGMSACVACAPGTYQATVDAYTECTDCPIMSSSYASATACFACSSGTFALVAGSPSCSSCPSTGYFGADCRSASPEVLCKPGMNCLEGQGYTVGLGFNVLKNSGTRPAEVQLLTRVLGVNVAQQEVVVPLLSATTAYSYSSSMQVTPKNELTADASSTVFRSTSEMRSSMAASLGIPPIPGMFSGSASYSKARTAMAKSETVTTFRKTQLQYLSLLLKAGSPVVPEFVRAVVRDLPTPRSAYDQTYDDAYSRFVASYGTHYVTSVVMGGDCEMTIEIENCYTARTSSTELSAQISKSFGAATGQASASAKQESASSDFKENSKSSLFVSGGSADGVTDTSMVMATWQQSVPLKMVPVSFTLGDLPSVVSGIDAAKAARLAQYIMEQYAAQYNMSDDKAVVTKTALQCGYFGAATARTQGSALALALTAVASLLMLQL